MDELVSVVIPVFNGEKYVVQAIQSSLQQSYSSVEVIVVDDGSIDTTPILIANEQRNDPRVRIIYQKNQGSASARNTGIALAKGEFIALLDADDIMFVERIQKQMKFLCENPKLAAVSCLAYYINDRNEIIGRNYSDLNNPDVVHQYLRQNKIIFCLQSGILMKKNVVLELGGYRNDLLYGQDTELWNRLVERGFSLMVMPEILVKYRIHPMSSMTHFEKRFDYADWLVDNIHLRRRGMPEISFIEFKQNMESSPWRKKLLRRINHRGVHFYRTAGLMYAEKKMLRFLFYLSISFFLKPVYTIKKLYRQRFRENALFN